MIPIATGCASSNCRPGDGSADVVQIGAGQHKAPNIEKPSGRQIDSQDLSLCAVSTWAFSAKTFGVMARASLLHQDRLATCPHLHRQARLKDLAREAPRSRCVQAAADSPTGAPKKLSDAQVAYAATDVLHLHALKEKLDVMLAREGRTDLAAACFRFLPDRARLDLAGWAAEDIFSHSS